MHCQERRPELLPSAASADSWVRVYLALGANLGQPLVQLIEARLALLNCPWFRLRASSHLYRTIAVSREPQPDYLNAVLAGECALPALQLLHELLALERRFGRARSEQRDAARTLDLDLLTYDQLECARGELELPHPRMHTRAFVLAPLAELAPELVVRGQSIRFWLDRVDQSGVIRLSPEAAKGWFDVRI